MKQTTCMNKKS